MPVSADSGVMQVASAYAPGAPLRDAELMRQAAALLQEAQVQRGRGLAGQCDRVRLHMPSPADAKRGSGPPASASM
jgi:hypothetical protein